MPLLQPTKDFLWYLQQNPAVRVLIRAAPGRTWLDAGAFFRPMWQEIAMQTRSSPQLANKEEVLPDVLAQSRCREPRIPICLRGRKILTVCSPGERTASSRGVPSRVCLQPMRSGRCPSAWDRRWAGIRRSLLLPKSRYWREI